MKDLATRLVQNVLCLWRDGMPMPHRQTQSCLAAGIERAHPGVTHGGQAHLRFDVALCTLFKIREILKRGPGAQRRAAEAVSG